MRAVRVVLVRCVLCVCVWQRWLLLCVVVYVGAYWAIRTS